jgi:hypothetical protein
VLLYIWIIAFAYDEFGEIQDAGLMFYRTDFWSLWDVAIIIVAIAFSITSEPRCTERAFAALLTCCQGLSVSSSKIRT